MLLPLLSSFLIVFFGKRMPGGGAELGIPAVAAGFFLSVLTLWHFVSGGGSFERGLEWARVGPFTLEIGEHVDGLTAVMFVVVTLVSLCVQVYSIGYMRGDRSTRGTSLSIPVHRVDAETWSLRTTCSSS